jgi:hypothetical protein
VQALELRHVPAHDRSSSAGQPARRAQRRQLAGSAATPAPRPAARTQQRRAGSAASHRVEQRARVAGPDARHELRDAEARQRLRGFSAQRSTASTSLTCAASRNLQPAELHERDVAPRELELERALWCAARNSTACALQRQPPRAARARVGDPARLLGLVATVDQRGRCATRARVHSVLLKRSAASAITAFDAARIGCVER